MPNKSEPYAHATTHDRLLAILNTGNIKSLTQLNKTNPELQVNIEPNRWSRDRVTLPIGKAIKKLTEVQKHPDKVFLTKNSYEPSYGDHVIVKQLSHPKPFTDLNTIADEHTTRRNLSVRNNAVIYVPEDTISGFKKKYPKITFENINNINLRKHTAKDKPRAILQKLRDKLFTKTSATPKYNSRQRLVGSKALGTALHDSSDTDIFIPYKTKSGYLNAISSLQRKHPELKLARQRENKTTFTQNDTDVVLCWGDPASRFLSTFKNVKKSLTPEDKQRIVAKKSKLKNAWIFPETRYKRYKNALAEKQGLKEVYF